MKKSLWVVAVVLVAALPLRYAWEAAERRKERAEAAEEAVRAAEFYEDGYAANQRAQWHDARMALLNRHMDEMERMRVRHDQEDMADRISENIRPGSAGHHDGKQWEEFQKLLERQEEEMAEFERKSPAP